MATLTLQLLEGLERGRVLQNLPTPVTIGREDENSIRLNDERVSRFHAKIQEDAGKLILTDLESTNGTRVNGHPIQMRVLQLGDQISIGRCLMVFGSEAEISARSQELQKEDKTGLDSGDFTVSGGGDQATGMPRGVDSGSVYRVGDDRYIELFPAGAPDLPAELKPAQRAQVSDFLAYCHEQVRQVLYAAVEEEAGEEFLPDDEQARNMRVSWAAWQRLLKLEMDIAVCMRRLAEPEHR
ncbi:MAG: FHA domain-containing protein [Planctomycetaceae bacterium]